MVPAKDLTEHSFPCWEHSLKTLKSKWTQHISTLVYAYNCTHSNATGFSPYYLLYGRHPLLSIDIEFGVFVPDLSEAITYKYVQELKKRLENVFQKANAFCEKEAIRSKQHFDRTARCSKLLPGDLVLVKKKGFTSKHKIADKWETEPYEIVSQRSDGLPVYTVVRNDRERTLHCNMLFLLGLHHDSENIWNDTGNSEKLHTKKLMKANILMDQMFDVDYVHISEADNVVDSVQLTESLRDLILQFWYQQVFTVYMVCGDLAEAGTRSINC